MTRMRFIDHIRPALHDVASVCARAGAVLGTLFVPVLVALAIPGKNPWVGVPVWVGLQLVAVVLFVALARWLDER